MTFYPNSCPLLAWLAARRVMLSARLKHWQVCARIKESPRTRAVKFAAHSIRGCVEKTELMGMVPITVSRESDWLKLRSDSGGRSRQH
jgi:hypothetical protein